jgi:hypothetical protein
MREICASGSVGGEGGNVLAYPAKDKLPPPSSRVADRLSWVGDWSGAQEAGGPSMCDKMLSGCLERWSCER